VFNAESAGFEAFAQQGVCAHHPVFLNEDLVSPFLDTGVNLNMFAVGGCLFELDV
jgi:hypothetical protein